MFVSQRQDHCRRPENNNSKQNGKIAVSKNVEAEDGWGIRGGRDELSRQ